MARTRERSPSPALPEPHGHGLRLRGWDPESDADAEAWLRGVRDPDFLRWNTPLRPVTDIDGAREALRARVLDAADGRSVSFRITDADSGATLGHLGVNRMDHGLRRACVGYWVLPEARGRGVATRSLLLAARWAFGVLGMHRLELDHALGHEASCRVAERCGFRHEGTMRGALLQPERRDAFRDAHLHARLATDPEPTAPRTTASRGGRGSGDGA
ncbi:GNAT family N-acetyltransferase [Streptomyces sp. enrichment culture]|uniref:GNAT family N-acetyltransferase n=1 Tax=Streptomyces sp. enrichment culture TaxID=1795815 RepID=UPI003F547E8B